MNISLNQLYRVLGISKQAVHQYDHRQEIFDKKVRDLMIEAEELRAAHPGCGVEKMYNTLKPDFIGRDRFVELFMDLGYRLKRIKNYHRTTVPIANKYPNLIEGLVVQRKNTLWQSDITYYDVGGRFYYLVFIIDIYTREILGYAVSDHMRAEANIKALKMALRHGAPMIHHSDRGSQYIDRGYLKLLAEHDVQVSMGLQAQDNAYAERLNGTIKNEYLRYWRIRSFAELKSKVKKAVDHYNKKRIHNSLPGKVSPDELGSNQGIIRLVEEIYAPERIMPVERSFDRHDEILENELYCNIE